jgi:hypothetical protein
MPKQLITITSETEENSVESLFVIHSAYYIDKTILCQKINDADHINKNFLTLLTLRLELNYSLKVYI